MRETTFAKALFLLTIFISLASCQKEPTITTTPSIEIQANTNQLSQVITDLSLLSNRVVQQNQLVILEDNNTTRPAFSDSEEKVLTPSNDIVWLYIADVETLNYNGFDMSATHIEIKGDFAYVSYHVRGDTHLGAIEVINISDGENPFVVSQAFFDDADVNGIKLDENGTTGNQKLWVAVSDANKGAVMCELIVINGNIQSTYAYVNLSNELVEGITASANSVEQAGGKLYVTAGKSYGGVFTFNESDLAYEGHSSFTNAKYVAANGNSAANQVVALQTGDQAGFKVDAVGNSVFPDTYQIDQIVHQNTDSPYKGKNSIHFQPDNEDLIYISMGENGFQSFDVTTGTQVYKTPVDYLNKGNVNGLSFHEDLFYVANGADGLAVFNTPATAQDEPELVFVWDLGEEDASANFVVAESDWVFIAKGQGGTKILRKPEAGSLLPLSAFDEDGVPDNLAPDEVICETLLPNIFANALPEGQNAITSHPEYFENTVHTEIHLTEEAELHLTFVHEGAGYKNTLGYYYYDAANPPATSDDLAKIVIFPNASEAGSGGNLVAGNTMEILGTFAQNTVVGFFLIADGWQGAITNGNDTHYTIPEFNGFENVQSIIFHDNTCESTVICFEDINTTTGGDKDFNDAIFQIKASPETAIDYSTLIGL